MKSFPNIRRLCEALFPVAVLLIAFACFSWIVPEPEINDKFISIEKLAGDHRLKVDIEGLGGHQQECVEFDLKNLTADTLFVQIEPGRRLHSEDTTAQDILIVKRKNVTLVPYASVRVNGYGFCCKSHHHSPSAKSKFTVGSMAPATWQRLAQVIDANSFPAPAIQAAVWSLSNDHPLSAIDAKDPASVDLLKRTVASIKGIEVPWYTLRFEEDASSLFSGRHSLLTGELSYSINGNTMVSIVVKNQSGQLVKTLVKGDPQSSGEHIFDLKLVVANWPKGDYTICIYEDYSNLKKKMGFTL